jgi:hypothetical protein
MSRSGPPMAKANRRGDRPLWRCATCRRAFANRNQSHACGRHRLAAHFAGKDPQIRALFDCVADAIKAIGPVRVLPEKTPARSSTWREMS